MRFRFIGDPRDGSGPERVEMAPGVVIGRAEFVEVPDALAAKLINNSHFELGPDIVLETVVESAEPQKRKPGWPKGRPRKLKAPMLGADIAADTGDDDDE